MKAALHFVPYAILVTALLMVSTPASARYKCWTNSEGVRECGKTVPPEYAQQGHEEMSKHGTVAKKKDRARTEEELAILQEEKLKRQEEKQALAERKRHDSILLNTFSSVEDIEHVRDEKIAALDTTISLTNKRSEKIQEDLDKRVKRAAAQERSGEQPSEKLLKSITSLKRQIKNNDDFIAEKRLEQEDIRAQYARDIDRYKELTEN
ncbi:MAG: hypothetical protein MI673_07010 [Thiotrichales bacterium]|nr:hypothetical protein [Thiotrichales bacterium]